MNLTRPLDFLFTSSVKQELCFLTYTPVFIIGIFILFIVTCRHNLVLYSLTSADIIAHDVCMVIYALIATSLPVRIARLERRKAQSMIVNAKKNVSHALNAPLRILLSELDLMLGDDSVSTHSYPLITLSYPLATSHISNNNSRILLIITLSYPLITLPYIFITHISSSNYDIGGEFAFLS